MDDTCLMCCLPKKLSFEHIIPQCLGGTLEKRLYCEECNKQQGHDIDSEIAKQFGKYATLLDIERERGENQPFIVNDENTGLALKFDGKKFSRAKPMVTKNINSDGKLEGVEVIARSQNEFKRIFGGIAKKHNIDVCLVEADEIEHPSPATSDELCLENDKIYKAVTKIAYGFACWKLPRDIILSEQFSKIRSYLKGEINEQFASINYEHTGFMTDNMRPLHKIHLSFNRDEKLIVGYVALFGVFRYTILLSDTYTSSINWPAVDYTYDPVNKREVPVNLNFSAKQLTKDQVINPKHNERNVLENLEKGMAVISEYSSGLHEIIIEPNSR